VRFISFKTMSAGLNAHWRIIEYSKISPPGSAFDKVSLKIGIAPPGSTKSMIHGVTWRNLGIALLESKRFCSWRSNAMRAGPRNTLWAVLGS
jgi:hypothetical protein